MRLRIMARCLLVLLLAIPNCFLPSSARGEVPQAKLEFQNGDRIVLLGDAFIERWQGEEYLETALTLRWPAKKLVFRNLGWSGDNVWGEARAVFGQVNDGFKRLVNDVRECRPTLIVLAYGANEANSGKSNLPEFRAGMLRLLDALAKIDPAAPPRFALLSPRKRENLGPPFPDQVGYNLVVQQYAEVVRTIAAERNIPYIDLLNLRGSAGPKSPVDSQTVEPWTENGIHLSTIGQWKAAPDMLSQLGMQLPSITVGIEAGSSIVDASGAKLSDLKSSADGIECQMILDRLPYPGRPIALDSEEAAPSQKRSPMDSAIMRVTKMTPGNYVLRIDDKEVGKYSHQQLADGVSVFSASDFEQVAALRRTIREKNELYFHRYRPQNETYLFLFRKHEQGRNAVEIPQFDPLVEAKEAEIAKLRMPHARSVKVVKLP